MSFVFPESENSHKTPLRKLILIQISDTININSTITFSNNGSYKY